MERVFFTCRKLSVINNNFNNNHFTFCQNDFKYSPSNSHPSYKPFGLLVFLRITWTRVIIYCPKPNPFLRPPTFCSPLSHPLPPPTTPKRNINKKDNERMNASMQETVDPGEPRQVSCEVKSHNHPKTSAMKCSPSLYNQSSCIFCLRRLLCTNGFCHHWPISRAQYQVCTADLFTPLNAVVVWEHGTG